MRQLLPSPDSLEAWSAGAKALGDPTRLAIAVALGEAGGACVSDLAWIVEGFAGVIIIWRFTGSRVMRSSPQRATRPAQCQPQTQ